jgi:hypothetical protein
VHCTTRPRRKWSAFLFSACAVYIYIYVFIFLGAIITPLATTTTVTTCSEMQLVPIPSPYIARVYGWGRILFPIPFACHEFHDAPARRGGEARHTVWRRSTEFVYVVIYCEQPTHPLLWRSSFARGQSSSNFFFSFIRPFTNVGQGYHVYLYTHNLFCQHVSDIYLGNQSTFERVLLLLLLFSFFRLCF